MKQVDTLLKPNYNLHYLYQQYPERLIVLSFDQESRNGFIFENDNNQYDILFINQSSTDNISCIHFRISFDFYSRTFMIYDLFFNFTIFQSKSLDLTTQLIRKAILILDEDYIQAEYIWFHIYISHHEEYNHAEYIHNINIYLEVRLS